MSATRARKPGWLVLGMIALVAILIGGAWGARAAARRMAFFRVRAVEVQGAQFLQADEVIARLRVDTLASLWDDLEPLRRRMASHPQVSSVSIGRKMPGTLVVTIEENVPVALVVTQGGLQPFDSLGMQLPIDPTVQAIDLPVVASNDPVLLKLVGAIRSAEPQLFARVEEVRRTGRDEILLTLSNGPSVVRVRALTGLSVVRLADIFPVESDLARRQVRVEELDLRFRDQVIARLQ